MIVLFGGTFDPVHLGHLHAARTVLALPEVDEVRMLVAADPPHRSGVTGAAHRHAMLELACGPIPGLVADDLELKRDGPSYSVDTLALFRDRHPDEPLAWVIGLDAFLAFSTWRDYRRVLDLAHLLVLKRPGSEPVFGPELDALVQRHRQNRLPANTAGAVVFLASEMLDISASGLRKRMAHGADVADLLPEPVHTYITAHRLYTDR